MSKIYNIPLWLIVSIFGYIFMLKSAILWLVWEWIKKRFLDRIIIIDKNNRWKEWTLKLSGRQTVPHKGEEYVLQPDRGILNHRGKALYIFSEGKPAPMHIEYNKHEWLDSKSIMGVLQNKMVQQIVKPTDKFIDMLLIMGALGGIVACLASIVNVLIATGVIKPTP